MKKTILLIASLFLTLGVTTLASCQVGGSPKDTKMKVAMVTDQADIDDRSFNQGTWEGMSKYLDKKGYKVNKDYKYFKPNSNSSADYINSIDACVLWGAKAIICPGFLFEKPVWEAQQKYPDVKFLIEDGIPHDFDDLGNPLEPSISDNTLSLFFKEHESGFLAGYAAVKDGFSNLGYMGGTSVPAVKKFGIGFAGGAYYAAHEMNKNINFADEHFKYLGTFEASPGIKTEAKAWYDSGVECIFTAAGGAGASVMAAAEETNDWMIGVDVDQGYMNRTVLTSAYKALDAAVALFLDRVFGTWQGGESLAIGVETNAVGLPLKDESWRFRTFSKEQYNDIYAKLVDGTVKAPIDYDELKTFVEGMGQTLSLTADKVNDIKH